MSQRPEIPHRFDCLVRSMKNMKIWRPNYVDFQWSWLLILLFLGYTPAQTLVGPTLSFNKFYFCKLRAQSVYECETGSSFTSRKRNSINLMKLKKILVKSQFWIRWFNEFSFVFRIPTSIFCRFKKKKLWRIF